MKGNGERVRNALESAEQFGPNSEERVICEIGWLNLLSQVVLSLLHVIFLK